MQGKINRIIFFEGDIETTGYFSRQMEKTFLKEGYQTYFFDYGKAAKSGEKRRLLPSIIMACAEKMKLYMMKSWVVISGIPLIFHVSILS